MPAKYPKVNLTWEDKVWLQSRADANHRSIVGEISAIRDLITVYESRNAPKVLDTLPHPEDATLVPVVEEAKQ